MFDRFGFASKKSLSIIVEYFSTIAISSEWESSFYIYLFNTYFQFKFSKFNAGFC